MNTPIISIIVPVYKVEQYLPVCLDSILSQTFEKWECILVDDGSPDNCGKICDEYAIKDKRFHVIHQQNQGVNAARKNGFEQSQGTFICFVDSDDTIYPESLQALYDCMSDDVDITVGKVDRDNFYHLHYKKQLPNDVYRHSIIKHCFNGLYAKLYRRELFDNSIFDTPRSFIVGEDWLASIRLAFKTEKQVRLTDKDVYYYRQHPISIMHTFRRTPDYEYTSYLYGKSAIPDKLKTEYIPSLLANQLDIFQHIFYYCNYNPQDGWIGSEIQQEMIYDAKKYNVYFSSLDQMICFTNMPFLCRKSLIFLWKSIRKTKKIYSQLFNELK